MALERLLGWQVGYNDFLDPNQRVFKGLEDSLPKPTRTKNYIYKEKSVFRFPEQVSAREITEHFR